MGSNRQGAQSARKLYRNSELLNGDKNVFKMVQKKNC